MQDIIFRERKLQRWNSALRHARIVQLERAGHLPQEETPQKIIKVLMPPMQRRKFALQPDGKWQECDEHMISFGQIVSI